MALSIDFSIEITTEVDVEVNVDVENSADAEYGIETEYEAEVLDLENLLPQLPNHYCNWSMPCENYANWGGGASVPAKGWFDQDGQKYSVEFLDFRLEANGDIRGCGKDVIGQFDIIGRLNASGYFKFEKIYKGAHTVDLKWINSLPHSVVFTGKRHGSNLTGKWEIPEKCEGVFKIQTGWQKWSGGSWPHGNFKAMELDYLYIGSDGVRGSGSDTVGTFDIIGGGGSKPWFTQQYHGKHTLVYYGKLNGGVLSGRCVTNPVKQASWNIQGDVIRLTCSRS